MRGAHTSCDRAGSGRTAISRTSARCTSGLTAEAATPARQHLGRIDNHDTDTDAAVRSSCGRGGCTSPTISTRTPAWFDSDASPRHAASRSSDSSWSSGAQSGTESRALMVVAAASLAAVVVLSVLLAKRHANASPQPVYNPTQFAVSSSLQAANQIYGSNQNGFPKGQALISQLQHTDPGLNFAFGPQAISPPNNASAPLGATDISVGVSQDGEVITFAAQASDGTCWYATDNHETQSATGGLDGASQTRGTSYASATNQTSCTAGAALPSNVTPWSANWPSS